MKKLILAFVALAFAFAISSCCDQNYCPENMRCNEQPQEKENRGYTCPNERPYRFDKGRKFKCPKPEPYEVCPQDDSPTVRQHRRW